MGSLKYYEDLIQQWQWATEPDPGYAFDYDTAPVWLPVRDAIHEEGLDDDPRVKELDKQAILYAIKEGSDMPMERDYEDIRRWWWHLEKIARGQYPAELLPDYLREIYLKAQKGGFSSGEGIIYGSEVFERF
jgi:hypothetical protein